MRKVQDIVRETFPGAWVAGTSRCYNNLTWSKDYSKRNFKFEFMTMPAGAASREQDLRQVLEAEGYRVSSLHVGLYGLQVWLEKEPRAD